MRTIFLALTFGVAAFILSAAKPDPNIRTLKHLGGPKPEVLLEDRDGGYVIMRNSPFNDTLLVWIEHVLKGEKPDYESAEHADMVVWCYPQDNPHPRHVLPEAEGLVGLYKKGSKYWVAETSKMTDLGFLSPN